MALIDEARAAMTPLPDPQGRRRIRLAACVTQAGMARELRVHRQTFLGWEKGTVSPVGDNRVRYAQLLAELEQATAGATGVPVEEETQ